MAAKHKKKKTVLLVKLFGHQSEHGIPYDKKFLSLALYYLEACANTDLSVRHGIDFRIKLFDAADDSESILRLIYEEKPDAVAYSSYLSEFGKTVEVARKVGFVLPDALQIIGGPSVRYPEAFLKDNPFFGAVVEGEGELAFTAMMRSFEAGRGFNGIPSVTYRNGNRIISNKPNGERIEIDNIPVVFTEEFMRGTSGIAICETSRGCLNNCRFCGLGIVGMRCHSMERIESDLATIFSRPEIRRVFIGDSNFFTDTERSMQLIEIIQRHNRHKAQIEFYADFLAADDRLLAECRRAYVHDSLRIPIQTCTPDALSLAGRGWFDFDTVRNTAANVMKHFPSTWGEIIVGLPGDDYEGIKGSIRWCAENGLSQVRCHRLKSLPGSEYTKRPEVYGIVADETPPHTIYRSNTFSFDEILLAEDLNRNYQIISPFIRTFDVLRMKDELGIDIIEEAENLDPSGTEWAGLFRIDEEGNISETKTDAAALVVRHLANRNKLKKNTESFLEALFRYRHTALSLYNYYKQNVIYNTEYVESEKMLTGYAPVVPMSAAYRSKYDIAAYLRGEAKLAAPKESDTRVVFLYSRAANAAVPWPESGSGALDIVLSNLGMLLEKGGRAKGAAEIANTLLEQGYVYFIKNKTPEKKTKRGTAG